MNTGIKNLYDDTVFVSAAENKLDLQLGSKVIFEQKERGQQFGEIVFLDRQKLAADEIILDGKILRQANKKDLEKLEQNATEADQALEKARTKSPN